MADQAPPAAAGCVYGPWWDELLGAWLCIVDDYPGYWDVRYLHWDFEDVLESPMSRELLRLAKLNAELRASQSSEEDQAVLWLIREWDWTIHDSKGGWVREDGNNWTAFNPTEEAKKLGWGG